MHFGRENCRSYRNLDGVKHTTAIFCANEDKHLTVSGGNGGRYIAFVTFGIDDAFHNLTDPTQPADQCVKLMTGGQLVHPGRFDCPPGRRAFPVYQWESSPIFTH
jgi:hypothetical protein